MMQNVEVTDLPKASPATEGSEVNSGGLCRPAPHPGQMWNFNDTHHGNVLAIVQGEDEPGNWFLLTFSRINGSWVKGYRDVLAYASDFERSGAIYLGDLPTFPCLDA